LDGKSSFVLVLEIVFHPRMVIQDGNSQTDSRFHESHKADAPHGIWLIDWSLWINLGLEGWLERSVGHRWTESKMTSSLPPVPRPACRGVREMGH
jgi:hypothetical protein